MKLPIDIGARVSGVIDIGKGIIGLIGELSPDAATRKANRFKRLLRKGKRQLKHSFKGMPVETYVTVNFWEFEAEQRAAAIEYLTETLK